MKDAAHVIESESGRKVGENGPKTKKNTLKIFLAILLNISYLTLFKFRAIFIVFHNLQGANFLIVEHLVLQFICIFNIF